MLTVSDGFKQSVSETEREMKGYVEVSYTDSEAKENSQISDFPFPLKIGRDFISSSGIIDNDRIGKNYASLEQDYFLLDGTFVLPNNVANKNPGIGYVSADTFEDDSTIPTSPFIISIYPAGTASGVTLYFKNNKPLDLEVSVTSGQNIETFTTNDMIIQKNGTVIIPFSERSIDTIHVYVKDVLYANRRIRLQEIDFGISAIYEGTDLVRFKTIEQCNRFCNEVPINQCEVVLGDYQDDFDSINPKGITKYLTSNTIIKPYAGVLTEENGVEYCQQGWYVLDSWKKTEDDVTLNGKGLISKLQDTIYCTSNYDYNIFYDYYENVEGINIIITSNKNASPYQNDAPYPLVDAYKLCSGIEAIQKAYMYHGLSLCESKRQGYWYNKDIELKNMYFGKTDDIVKRIGADILTKYQEITINPPIRSINIKEYQYPSHQSVSNVLYETTLVCDGEETLVYDYGKFYGTQTYIICNDYSSLQIIDARNHIYDSNDNLIYTPTYGGELLTYSYAKIRYNGTLTFRVVGNDEYKEEISENEIKYGKDGIDIKIDNSYICGSNSRTCSNYYANFRKENHNDYSTKFSYNGDPSVELGDNIEVESKFKDNGNTQYDLVWVTKIESEFDGSFNQTIEGDILE